MAILDAKLPAWQASTKALSVTKAEAKTLEGKVPLVIDGGSLGFETRVLLKNQSTTSQNGLYEITTNEVVGGTGTVGGSGKVGTGESWVLTRTADADSSGEVTEGMLVQIEDGDTNQRTSWIQRSPGPIEVGVSPQTFEPLSALPGGQIQAGQLENTYVEPLIKEAIIDNTKIEASAGIKASKLDLKEAVAASDLTPATKETFLQLLTSASRKAVFGTATLEWPGGNVQSNTLKISHGLGVEPKAVLAIESSFSVPAACYCGEKGATTFSVLAHTVNAAVPAKGFTCQVDWLAIG